MKSQTFIREGGLIEGRVSHILYLDLSFHFVKKRVTFYRIFFISYVLFFKNITKKDIKIVRHFWVHMFL